MTPATLDELLDQLRDGRIADDDMADLPTFGGAEPGDTQGVWSWDAARLIVGTCPDDYAIVPRDRQ